MTADLSGGTPQGSMVSSGIKTLQGTTEDDIRNNLYGQQRSVWGNAKQSMFGAFLGSVFGGITDFITGVATSLPFWFPKPAAQFAQTIKDGQTDLNNRTDLLSPLLDYCSVSSNPGSGEHRVSNNRFPFNYQIGPTRNVTNMGDGRLRLDDKGLWDLRAMVTSSYMNFLGDTQMQVFLRVLKPDGGLHSVYSEQGYYMKTTENVTMTLVSSVVVPEPGYFVDVYIIGPDNRGYWVGPKWNRLTVQHISREVKNGTGSEGSANPTNPPE